MINYRPDMNFERKRDSDDKRDFGRFDGQDNVPADHRRKNSEINLDQQGIMEEVLKHLKIAPKVLAKRLYAMWEILLATKEEARQLTGIILMAKTVHLQTEYMGTRKISVIVHEVPADITEDRLGTIFCEI